jgi:uncharacterized protein YbaP (TraB family)
MRQFKQTFAAVLLLLFWAAAQAAPYSHGLLWKIERAGQAPSYVFGTIHSEDARVLTLPEPVQRVFDGSKTYVMEALLDESALVTMSSSMLFNDGRTLKDVLSVSTYSKTVSAMTDFGMPEAGLQLMQPWAVAMTLSTPKPKTGIVLDLSLMQQAMAQGKQTAGLETVEEQVGIFAGLPMNEQVLLLEDALQQLSDIQQTFATMHELYLARDLAGLERLNVAQQAMGNQKLEQKLMLQLVEKRNQRMAARMEPYFKSGQAFIAIGALHLPGAAGVLNLLAQKGYCISVVY